MMVNHLKYVLISFLVASFATSCNGDVFLDGHEMPDETNITLEGDGGETEIGVQTKGLEWIGIDHYSDDLGFKFYNREGKLVKEECPVMDLALIRYENRWMMYDLTIDNGRIVFHSKENSYGDTLSVTIRLRYDYTVKFINIELCPGQESEAVNITYDQEIIETTIPYKSYRTFRINNNSQSTQYVEIDPYAGFQAHGIVEPSENWARIKKIKLKLPTDVDGTWCLGNEMEVVPEVTFNYTPKNLNVKEKVEIPPESTTYIRTAVTMSKAKSRGTIEYVNPLSGRTFSTHFTCEAVEPTGYEIITTSDEYE